MKFVKLFEGFLNEGKIDDLRSALDKTPTEKIDIIVNTKGMETIVHQLELDGVKGKEATEDQLQQLFKAVDNKLYYPRLPISYFFDVPNELTKGVKLIHLTNHADIIVKDGFTRGTQDLNNLGMS